MTADPDMSAFANVLFRGHEWALLIFEMLVFACADLIWDSTGVRAAVCACACECQCSLPITRLYTIVQVSVGGTYVVAKLLSWLRQWAGQRNIVAKTLVDGRFLV